MRFLSLLSVVLCATIGTTCALSIYKKVCLDIVEDDSFPLYTIKTTTGGFVLDAVDPNQVRIKEFIGTPIQLWRFKKGTKPELSFIINALTGKVLDWKQNAPAAPTPTSLITTKFNGTLRQQWYLNSNGRIENAECGLNIDVNAANFVRNNPVILWKDNGNKAQEFAVERIN